jgi:hypothetical protein
MPPTRNRESATDLSALMALARIREKNKVVSRANVLKTLRTPWAKRLGEAMIDQEVEKKLPRDLAKDLRNVRQLAGVAD